MGAVYRQTIKADIMRTIEVVKDAKVQKRELQIADDGKVSCKSGSSSSTFASMTVRKDDALTKDEIRKTNQMIVSKFIGDLNRFIESEFDEEDKKGRAKIKLERLLRINDHNPESDNSITQLGRLQNEGADVLDPNLLLNAFKLVESEIKGSQADELANKVLLQDELLPDELDLKNRSSTLQEWVMDLEKRRENLHLERSFMSKNSEGSISEEWHELSQKISNVDEAIEKIEKAISRNGKDLEAFFKNEENLFGENKVRGLYHFKMPDWHRAAHVEYKESLKATEGDRLDEVSGLASQFARDASRQTSQFIDAAGNKKSVNSSVDAIAELKHFAKDNMKAAEALSCLMNQTGPNDHLKVFSSGPLFPKCMFMGDGGATRSSLIHTLKRLPNNNVEYSYIVCQPLKAIVKQSDQRVIELEEWDKNYPANKDDFDLKHGATYELDAIALERGEIKIVGFRDDFLDLNYKPIDNDEDFIDAPSRSSTPDFTESAEPPFSINGDKFERAAPSISSNRKIMKCGFELAMHFQEIDSATEDDAKLKLLDKDSELFKLLQEHNGAPSLDDEHVSVYLQLVSASKELRTFNRDPAQHAQDAYAEAQKSQINKQITQIAQKMDQDLRETVNQHNFVELEPVAQLNAKLKLFNKDSEIFKFLESYCGNPKLNGESISEYQRSIANALDTKSNIDFTTIALNAYLKAQRVENARSTIAIPQRLLDSISKPFPDDLKTQLRDMQAINWKHVITEEARDKFVKELGGDELKNMPVNSHSFADDFEQDLGRASFTFEVNGTTTKLMPRTESEKDVAKSLLHSISRGNLTVQATLSKLINQRGIANPMQKYATETFFPSGSMWMIKDSGIYDRTNFDYVYTIKESSDDSIICEYELFRVGDQLVLDNGKNIFPVNRDLALSGVPSIENYAEHQKVTIKLERKDLEAGNLIPTFINAPTIELHIKPDWGKISIHARDGGEFDKDFGY